MKTITRAIVALVAIGMTTSSHAMTMESIEARIGLGTTMDLQGFAGFFENGFTQGDPAHTETLSFDDGVVQVDFNITVEGFDENGAAAGLRTTTAAVGVDGPSDTVGESTRIDTDEQIKVTFNSVIFSIIGSPPVGLVVDPSSFEALISSIRFASFTQGTDTYTYAGVGAASVTGDDTEEIEFVPAQAITDGDMFTITGNSGEFRGLYMSLSGNYKSIPEPATFSLLAISLIGIAASRR